MARIFVGVAWPYANGPFHIGHLAGAYLPGEMFARFHRLKGDEVLMVSGSDMHGTPILVRAEAEGKSPEEVAFRYDAVNRDAFERLGFAFDLFTSTHTLVHERTVQEVFLALLENGFVARRTEENAYCPKHERFLPDRYLTGECPYCQFPSARGDECDRCGRVLEPKQLGHPKCSLCGTPAEFRPSEHFYLLLEKLAPALETFLSDKAHWRANVANVTAHFRRQGLHPTPITRDLSWGIPLPLEGYGSKRFYVWFDAVLGYLSASREWSIRAGKPEAWRRFWDPKESVRSYYFVGKDNIFHHTLLLPAILLGHGELRTPYDVPANEWLQVEGRKISKSRPSDTDAFIPSLLARYPPDQIRFYAAVLAPQNHDTEFDWDEFHTLYDEVLANQYGNLVQRALVLLRDRHQGRAPGAPKENAAPAGPSDRLAEAHRRITEEYEAVHLKEAVERALAEVREGNRRFHEAKPWQADPEARERALYETLWLVKAAAIWLAPVMPFSSAEVFRMLGYAQPPSPGDWDEALRPVPEGQALGEVRPLFPRRDTGRPAATAPSAPPAPATATAGAGEGSPLAIRAAVVRSAVPHPSADKLYVLTLDAGEPSPRTVVAGVRPFYRPEELEGRRVVFLANLQPRTIRKVTSQGMILAADSGDRATLLGAPDGVAPGTPVLGVAAPVREVEYAEFERSPLVLGRVLGDGGAGEVRVDVGGREVRARGRAPEGTRVVVRLDGPGGDRGEVLTFGEGLFVLPPGELPPGTRVR